MTSKDKLTTAEQVRRSAVISGCGIYRYRLDRWWGDGARAVFIMLNPSTADADVDDPTIRRCIGFAKSWGADGITVVNLFGLRATDPAELRKHTHPVGPENDVTIGEAAIAASEQKAPVVAAWGAHTMAERRGYMVVRDRFKTMGLQVKCLGKTKAGQPKHPLYVPAAQMLEDFA